MLDGAGVLVVMHIGQAADSDGVHGAVAFGGNSSAVVVTRGGTPHTALYVRIASSV